MYHIPDIPGYERRFNTRPKYITNIPYALTTVSSNSELIKFLLEATFFSFSENVFWFTIKSTHSSILARSLTYCQIHTILHGGSIKHAPS